MNTKDINRLIEQDAKLKGDVFKEKIQKLVGFQRKIYEAGIEEGLRLGAEITKSVLETIARLKEMEEDVKNNKM